jgi:hypothetical protein
VVAGNRFLGSDVGLSIYSVAAHGGTLVQDTEITNNVIRNGIDIIGGILSASENRVERVRITNNTVIGPGRGLRVFSDADGATGNSVAGVQVVNTIFQTESGDFIGEVLPEQVSHCITSIERFCGVNGNFSADPLFLDPTQNDYHLRPGSPAIDAGTGEGAPSCDLECRERASTPDVGAFEFNAASLVRLDLMTGGTGAGTVIPNPVGKNCHTADPVFYRVGTEVTLEAAAARSSLFVGWSGDNDCSDGIVTMDSNKTCVATFVSKQSRRAWKRQRSGRQDWVRPSLCR